MTEEEQQQPVPPQSSACIADEPAPFFNGGKMVHIFSFNDETKKYDPVFANAEAEQALLHGTLYYKIDGSNGMVQVLSSTKEEENDTNNEIQFKIYQRLDTKGKEPTKDTLIPLPEGKNVVEYSGHSYYYDEITLEGVTGKNLIKRNRAMIDLVQRHIHKFVGANGTTEWTSIEWVGTMFNKTPNVPHKIAIAIHKEQIVEGGGGGENDGNFSMDRTYEGVRNYLIEECADQPIEGFIIEHEGTYWKIRSDCFYMEDGSNKKDPFKANRENARPPIFLV